MTLHPSPWGQAAIDANVEHLYVAPGDQSANDRNPGNVAALPLSTLSEALRRANQVPFQSAPVVIHLASGSYAWAMTDILEGARRRAPTYIVGDGAGQSGDDGFAAPLASGTAQGGTGQFVLVTSGGLTPQELVGATIRFLDGAAVNTRRTVATNTAANVVPTEPWSIAAPSVAPQSGDAFEVARSAVNIDVESFALAALADPVIRKPMVGLGQPPYALQSGASNPRTAIGDGLVFANVNLRSDGAEAFAYFTASESRIGFYGCRLTDSNGTFNLIDPGAVFCGGDAYTIDAAFDRVVFAYGPVLAGLTADARDWGGWGLDCDGVNLNARSVFGHVTASDDTQQLFIGPNTDVQLFGGGFSGGLYFLNGCRGAVRAAVDHFWYVFNDTLAEVALGFDNCNMSLLNFNITKSNTPCAVSAAERTFLQMSAGTITAGAIVPANAIVASRASDIRVDADSAMTITGFGAGTQLAIRDAGGPTGALIAQADLATLTTAVMLPATGDDARWGRIFEVD